MSLGIRLSASLASCAVALWVTAVVGQPVVPEDGAPGASPVLQPEPTEPTLSRPVGPADAVPEAVLPVEQTEPESPWLKTVLELAETYYDLSNEYITVINTYINDLYTESEEQSQAIFREAIAKKKAKEAEARGEAIVSLDGFVVKYAKFSNDPQYRQHIADARFRLAQLRAESADYAAYLDRQNFTQRQEEYARGERPEPPSEAGIPDYSSAMNQYEIVIRDFPDYKYHDAALLGLATLHIQADYAVGAYTGRKKAITYLSQLIEIHPSSQFIPAGYNLLGQCYLATATDQEGLQASIAAFRRAAEITKSYGDAQYLDNLYYLGLASIRAYDYRGGLAALIAYLDFTEANSVGSADISEDVVILAAESLADQDWNNDGRVDDDGGPKRAFSIFTADKPYSQAVIEKYRGVLCMPRNYVDSQRLQECTLACSEYLSRYPLAKDAPVVHQTLIVALEKAANSRLATEMERASLLERASAERSRMRTLYGAGSAWAEYYRFDKKVLAQASEILFKHLKRRAEQMIQYAEQLKLSGRIEEARVAYRESTVAWNDYLSEVNNPTEVEYCLYHLGVAYLEMNDYEAAARTYERLRDFETPTEEGPIFWADAAVSAWTNAVYELSQRNDPNVRVPENLLQTKGDSSIAKFTPSDAEVPGSILLVEPYPIPPIVQNWITAALVFVDRGYVMPGKPDQAVNWLLVIGRIYFTYGHFDLARQTWERVIVQYRDNKNDVTQAYIGLLQSYDIVHDLDGAKVVEERLKKDTGVERKDLAVIQEQIEKKRQDTRYARATALYTAAGKSEDEKNMREARKKYAKAAREFELMVEENPEYPKADEELLHAADAYQKVKMYDRAAAIYARFVSDPKLAKSKYRVSAIYNMATMYELFYDFDAAAAGYVLYSQEIDDKEKVNQALVKASELYENSQKYAKAAELKELWLKKFPGDDNSVQFMEDIYVLYGKANERERATASAQAFIKKYTGYKVHEPRVLRAHMQLGRWALESGNTSQAREHFKRVRNIFVGLPQPADTAPLPQQIAFGELASLAAEAAFILAEMDAKESKPKAFYGGEKEFNTVLKDREKRIDKLVSGYEDAIKIVGVRWAVAYPWAIAAHYRCGQLYLELAGDMGKYQPEGLSGPELADARFAINQARGNIRPMALQHWGEAAAMMKESPSETSLTVEFLESLLLEFPEFRAQFPSVRPIEPLAPDVPSFGAAVVP